MTAFLNILRQAELRLHRCWSWCESKRNTEARHSGLHIATARQSVHIAKLGFVVGVLADILELRDKNPLYDVHAK